MYILPLNNTGSVAREWIFETKVTAVWTDPEDITISAETNQGNTIQVNLTSDLASVQGD